MMRDASGPTGGTFRLLAREVVANGEHAVAMVDRSAERDGERRDGERRDGEGLEGEEAAVYRVGDGKVVEASFHPDDVDLDRRFWE